MADEDQIKSYAVGILTEVMMGVELAQYLERIDATLEPFGGSFLVHGDEPFRRFAQPVSGSWSA